MTNFFRVGDLVERVNGDYQFAGYKGTVLIAEMREDQVPICHVAFQVGHEVAKWWCRESTLKLLEHNDYDLDA